MVAKEKISSAKDAKALVELYPRKDVQMCFPLCRQVMQSLAYGVLNDVVKLLKDGQNNN